ncbi:hypothetical protein GQ600_9735 [Phytophthora cactorum]|nr:hypothetical protein GQ600_9735 [Phytophthora cactorum]
MKQNKLVTDLEESIGHRRGDIQELKRQRRLIRCGIPTNRSLWGTATDLYATRGSICSQFAWKWSTRFTGGHNQGHSSNQRKHPALHLVSGSRWSTIAAKMLGQQLILRGSVHFTWDSVNRRVTSIVCKADTASSSSRELGRGFLRIRERSSDSRRQAGAK